MEIVKTVTTRQLLREFRIIKELLLTRQVDSVRLPIDDSELEIKVKVKPKTGADVVEGLKTLPPIKVRRDPELFNSLLRNRDRLSA